MNVHDVKRTRLQETMKRCQPRSWQTPARTEGMDWNVQLFEFRTHRIAFPQSERNLEIELRRVEVSSLRSKEQFCATATKSFD
jgi:hypothetical protein